MSTPLVSILITVYNRERYLAAAVESVLAQTFQDFEVIILDDCSQDRSLEIARQYQGDPRVRVVGNEKNLGQFPNRTRAAELARGHYLKYLDSDDLLYQHSLAIMVEAIEASPDAGLALSHSLREDKHPYPWKLTSVEAWRKQFLERGCLSAGPSAAILRREAFFAIGGFGDWGVLNDIDLWYRMAARWPVLLLQPGLVWWRRHEEQEFTRDNAAMVYLEKGFDLTMETLKSPECPLTAAQQHVAISRAKQHQARRILSWALRNRQPRQAWHLFLKSGMSLQDLVCGLGRYQ